ncbi:hypothetical protein P3T36_001820 [Kitasatospora sp. MAP12-15]|uniref:hypothetical protein n=1 Tax=unclassified Kitasatospora TaxID=2633591 RepID=UPI00247661A7|nr:hypothetical protein [Kitasatospora sp. MAP12-44]MDH6113296.1 hypothetical protein [Kitasatospora sp. MAP12-44]
MFKRDRNNPPDWARVQLPQLPAGVTAFSIPVFGTTWYERRWGYWTARTLYLAVAVAIVAVQLLMYKLILVDDPNTTHFGAIWWGVAVFGVLATAGGLRMALFGGGLPFARLRRHPRKLIANLFGLPLPLYLFCVAFLAPGLFLSFTVDGLRPTLYAERIAREDLDAQLRAHPGRTRKR